MPEETPPDDLLDTIAEAAANPRSATGDRGSMQQHSLPDLIAADKYRKANKALARNPLGIRMVKLRPGGNHDLSIGDCP